MKYYFILIFLFFTSCAEKKADKTTSIDYLGQEQPGNSPQVFGPDIVSVKGRFDMGLTIAPNGKTIAFGVAHETIPEETCIYLMNYIEGDWTSPDKSLLPDNINTFFPMFGPSGDEFYFAKSTNGAATDLWIATFLDNELIDTQPISGQVNSNFREAGHGLSSNGSFYFTSNRDEQNPCCGDIYYTKWNPADNMTVRKVTALSSIADEESLFLPENEEYMLIQAWKTEFDSKHDLYISYRMKKGGWTIPKRLNDQVNSKEIEQRPFVSPDNEFLFFSRTIINLENGTEVIDSDIYWVSTEAIFHPYPYNTQVAIQVQYNAPFQLNLPKDCFKDINDPELEYHAFLGDGADLPKWMNFDADQLTLKGVWQATDSLPIRIVAEDKDGNTGFFEFQLGESAIPN